ncbi:LysR family transcriptional regulator [Parvibaculum sp.]|uniref:LysR family transcriptional regulator n=1 Tax=Parvibaculum sp. TaxID=2024848 RepID=UPI001B0283BE|nr:LysR family transcriptional regulator [Parvibaculum sp.]MBO6635997.1 LysR family transcriptional regulator [Parvibaculum sp.]MBO6678544.1 LysR family transcriptional regulator [Parvibaculum sp.]MBO6686526.1 LysR family transcriptional regulator [Parvibaculum sp.]MBO6903737.1 LysR family transcriptional regulator [Parvibaculum sp.]
MTDATPGWELYRSFLAVVREGSLSGAARRLGLTQPTVGRHVDALEQALAVGLFTRSQGGLSPTDSALALVPHAEAMSMAAEALRRAASGEAEEDRGTVRITASEMIGAEVLPPILARFREKHPRIVIELVLSNRTDDLIRRDADIAIRMIRPTQSSLVARKAGEVRIGMHGHRKLIETMGMPKTLEDMERFPLIGFDRESSVQRIKDFGIDLSRDLFAFRCDSDLGQFAALKAGFGFGMCQYALARHIPDLVPVLTGLIHFDLDIWIAMHEDLKTSRRMRLMFDHLAEEMAAYAREGAGKPAAHTRK